MAKFTNLSLAVVLTVLTLVACALQSTSESLSSPEAEAESEPPFSLSDMNSYDLIVYSGRSSELMSPLFDQFERETGIHVGIRYGGTAELAATLLEEHDNSPADVYIAQDAGGLGAIAQEDLFEPLPSDLTDLVDSKYRSASNLWVGLSGRVRVLAYNASSVTSEDLPSTVMDMVDSKWRGRIGWSPTNGSFQAFVTAMRHVEGEEATRNWLKGMLENDPVAYPNNAVALDGVINGEVDVALINHYYLLRALDEQGKDLPVHLHYFSGGDVGSLVNVAGIGILRTSVHHENAFALVKFLLSSEAQSYFSEQTFEYPLIKDIVADPRLPPLSTLQSPDLDLSKLSDLNQTLELLQEVGVLE